VSGLDWSAVHNKIVSCSHDRNAFVWTFDNETNKWIPALVILRIDRGAFDVKWSNDGLRFAVTSGAKCVPVCTYDESNNWSVLPPSRLSLLLLRAVPVQVGEQNGEEEVQEHCPLLCLPSTEWTTPRHWCR
jgi:WD40 repeat protein